MKPEWTQPDKDYSPSVLDVDPDCRLIVFHDASGWGGSIMGRQLLGGADTREAAKRCMERAMLRIAYRAVGALSVQAPTVRCCPSCRQAYGGDGVVPCVDCMQSPPPKRPKRRAVEPETPRLRREVAGLYAQLAEPLRSRQEMGDAFNVERAYCETPEGVISMVRESLRFREREHNPYANGLDDAEPGDTFRAPWTPSIVEALRARQANGEAHPYTCENCGGKLYPTVAGWICTGCPYKQDWCLHTDAFPLG